jgi:hypothetical protein
VASLAVCSGLFVLACAGGGGIAPNSTSEPRDQERGGHESDYNYLITGNRPNLSICVHGAGGLSVSNDDVARVRAALEAGLLSVPDIPPEYGERVVSEGCPPPSAQLGQPASQWDIRGARVDVPSVHRVFVYLVSDATYSATFGAEPFVAAGEELVFSGDEGYPVTFGLYVPQSAPSDALSEGLLTVLRLRPHEPSPTPAIDWQACERGERPHPDFDCSNYEDRLRQLEEREEHSR